MLAHEIKNPLSGIRGSAQLLSSELSDNNYELTNIIIQEADRIDKIINKIEHLFSNELIEAEILNIHEIIDHAIKISQSSFSKKVIFKKLYDPSLPSITGNKNLLIQSFLNIIKNACEAIENDKRGIICVKTFYSLWEPKAKYFGSVKRITPIHIEITDNGNGVPDFIKNSLFNPFITSKNNGSGLGLTQVIGAMNAHSGKVEYLHSNSETTFRLSFPEENLI